MAPLIRRPSLFERLGEAERVVYLSAPAGSGKTFLLRSWIGAESLADRTAWVSVRRGEHDPQAFWLSVLDSLRRTRIGAELLRQLTAAPDLDGATVVARLLEDLSSLQEALWLVFDDLHELQADEVIHQLELLIATAPPELRLVLSTRRDLRLGLHRLRVEGELTEIRGKDLRFTVDESRALLEAAGVQLSDGALESLVAKTEGWAAGLRLAALSMASDPDPERLAASLSGRERAVAEYLLTEVLERQPAEVSRMLLRTSILERVSGPLADRLTAASGSERILWELEDANAFVVSLDADRTWFRYHNLFADLLGFELRRTAPGELPGLHTLAAEWLAEQGDPVEAIRHAQKAENWGLAVRLLADNHLSLYLDGRTTTVSDLLSAFPSAMVAADAELAQLAASDNMAQGSLDEAERYLALAEYRSETVPEGRRRRFQVSLVLVQLGLARARNDLDAVAERAQRLLALADGPEPIAMGVGDGSLQATALISLGAAEFWVAKFVEAERHLQQGVALASRIGRPYLELTGLVHASSLEFFRSFAVALEHSMRAVELADRHGWTDEPAVFLACINIGGILVWQGRLEDAEPWMQRAERCLRAEAGPADGVVAVSIRGLLELARGRDQEALASFQAAERLAGRLAEPNLMVHGNRSFLVQTLARLGQTERAEQVLAALGDDDRAGGAVRIGVATLRLAQDDPDGAIAALAPVLDGSAPLPWPAWLAQAFLLDAIARDTLGDSRAAESALERALDLAEPDGLLLPFMLRPEPELLERHRRSRTRHASLISEILNVLSGNTPATRPEHAEPLHEPLSDGELRVLRYLPTNLRGPEIAAQLFVSQNTIRTHLRNVYAKLGVHSRTDAVKRARELRLLSPSSIKH